MSFKIFEKDFLRNILLLITGTGLSQLIPVIFSVALTRVFSPQNFGVFAIFYAFSSVLSVFVTGRYELAIMLPKKDKTAIHILGTTFFLSLSLSCIMFVCILILQGWGLVENINGGLTNGVMRCLPLAIFFNSCFQSYTYWLNRKGKFKLITIMRVSQSLITALVSLFLGFLGHTTYGLVIGYIVGFIAPIIAIGFLLLKMKRVLYAKEIIQTAKQYREYPKLMMPTALCDVGAMQAPIFFISRYFSPSVTGGYSLSFRMVAAPLSVISSAIGQVYFRNVTNIINTGTQKTFTEILKTLRFLACISILIFLPLALGGKVIFSIVFGSEWAEAGKYVQILSFAMAVRFIVSPLSTILISAKKLKSLTVWQVTYLLTTSMIFIIFRKVDFIILLKIYVVHEIILYIIYLILILKTSKEIDSKMICVV